MSSPNKYRDATIIEQTALLSLIELNGSTFWIKTAQLSLPEPPSNATHGPETKKPQNLGFGKSQHKRWHVNRGIVSARCKFCAAA